MIIKKMKENIQKLNWNFPDLSKRFHEADVSISFTSNEVSRNFFLEYSSSVTAISDQLEEMCENRINRVSVEEMLLWKLKELKISCFDERISESRFLIQPGIIQVVTKCLTLLGRFQEAMDWLAHWRREKVPEDLGTTKSRLIVWFRRWRDGKYEKQDLTEPIDFFRYVTTDGTGEQELSLGFTLVTIKLWVIAAIRDHIKKREKFHSFIMGTHQRLGSRSSVLKISNCSPVIRTIAENCGVTTSILGVPSSSIDRNLLKKMRNTWNIF